MSEPDRDLGRDPFVAGRRGRTFGQRSLPNPTTVVLMVLCVGAGVGACAAQQVSGVPAAQDAAQTVVTLRIGESITPPGSTSVVTVTDVSDDSRCPADANCVWAGDATVTLRIQPAKGPAETAALHLNRPDARSATAAGLHLSLERLEPEPQAGRPIERGRYLAAIVISE
jgi:hypothetical protein